MATGALYVSHNMQGETGFVIMTWAKSVPPQTEIGRVVYPAPHVQEFYNIENLQPVWHIIRFWRSADGVSLDEEILTLAGNARTGAVYSLTRFEYIVGRGSGSSTPGEVWNDPAPDDSQLLDERLAGGSYFVEERATGSMLTSEYTVLPEGGFEWTGGKVFNDGGVYFVYLMNRIDAGGDTPVESDTIIITEDTDYDPALHSGKTLLVQGAANVITIAIPNLSTVTDSKFKVISHLGAQRNVVVQFDTGDSIVISQGAENAVILGVGEETEIEFIDNVAHITNGFNYDHAGIPQQLWSSVALPNKLKLSGQTIADVTQYPRLQWLLENRLSVISVAAWDVDANKSKWGYTFPVVRVPLPEDFYRNVQTNEGRFQLDGIKAHTHGFTTGDVAGRSDNANDRDVMLPNTPGMARTTNPSAVNVDGEDVTRPKNIGLIPYMTI